MAGNLLGDRRYFRYVDDLGNQYKYLTDQDLGDAVGATLDDASPDMPRRFEPRGVWIQATVDGKRVRKFMICPTSSNAVYRSNVAQDVTVDSQTFRTTGRKGEVKTFGVNPSGGALANP